MVVLCIYNLNTAGGDSLDLESTGIRSRTERTHNTFLYCGEAFQPSSLVPARLPGPVLLNADLNLAAHTRKQQAARVNTRFPKA